MKVVAWALRSVNSSKFPFSSLVSQLSQQRLLKPSALLSAGWQESLFDVHERGSLEKLYRGIDRLREKYGEESIGAATPRTRTR
jgi:hypothetical protein